MRLHTLRIRAVGPFADEHVVDFDRLGSGGLFLFEGPTGVGKSTILDALVFALYGGLACSSGDAARLHSDFAAANVRPEVAVDFSVRGTRHRITRSPEHTRPKKRGEGTTREAARVHLERHDGDGWTSRSHAKDEVGTIISELLGLNREQFRQVVLLPQGEFATFLQADHDERRAVLVKLFGTHFYTRISEVLQAQAQEVGRRLQVAERELWARMAAALEAAGREPDEHDSLRQDQPDAVLELLDRIGEGLSEGAAAAAGAAASSERATREARVALAEAEQAVVLVARKERAQEVLRRADASREEHQERLARLEDGRRAAAVGPLLGVVARAHEEVQVARADVEACAERHPVAEKVLAGGWQALSAAAISSRSAADGLRHLVDVECSVLGEQGRLEAARAALVAAESEEDALRRRGEELARRRESLALQVESTRTEAAGVEGAQRVADALRAEQEAWAELAALEAALPSLRERRRSERRQLTDATDTHELLVERRLSDLRGELAARLVQGQACLVCGSADHPSPASSTGSGVTDLDIREASRARHDARVALDEAELALARAEARRDQFRTITGSRTADEAGRALEAASHDVQRMRLAQACLGELEDQLSEVTAQCDELAGRQRDLAGRIAESRASVGLLGQEVDRRRERVDQAREGFPSVAARVASLEAEAQALDALAGALRRLEEAEGRHAGVVAQAEAEASAAGFAGLAEARAAALGPEVADDLRRSVEEWESAVAAARGALSDPELWQLGEVSGEDCGAARDARRAALLAREAESLEAERRSAVAALQRDRYADRLDDVRAAVADLERIGELGEEVVALDQYARGMAGHPRMALVTFVLRYWFEQVVRAANARLGTMSTGKYELIRIDEGSRRDARVGLGLAVLDRHTGRQRGTGTLSGGETFYTSLALALGLADVVTAQAGGAQLDTLFIDEGFGALDPDTLDDVMGVIDELRGGGRVVGIVSHVPELKERIAERLVVQRTRPDGPSTVRVEA